jgi:hypothetical protein
MGKAFAEVLDGYLEGVDATPPPAARAGFGIATQPFLFTAPPRPARPRRTLSPRQQLAFDTIAALGGRLSVDFTRDELRATFRGLALRYHPDRHPGSSDRETARLAASFSQVTAAYERLQTVFAAN